jgi:hypothetical protein
MKSLHAFVVALLLVASSSVPVVAQTVADVGPARVTQDDLIASLMDLRHTGDLTLALKTMTAAGREQVLDDLVARRLFALAGRRDGLDRDPAVKAAIDRAVDAILADAYAERAFAKEPITDQTLRAYYDSHKTELITPATVKARHIVVKTRPEAQRLLAELREGADFVTLAAERSTDSATRANGGELGWVPRGVMTPAFESVVFDLKPGQLSDVVETSFGFHVVRVDDVQQPVIPAFEIVKDQLRQRLAAERRKALIDRLKANYPVAVHRDVLDSLTK